MTSQGLLNKETLHNAILEFSNISEIAKYYEIPYSTVLRKLKKYNIETNIRKYSLDLNFFEEDNEKSFYWSGFIASSSSISTKISGKNCYRIFINSSIDMLDHLNYLSKDLKYDRNVNKSRNEKQNYDYVRFILNSKKIVNDLNKRFGITKDKTSEYKIPNRIINSELLHHFFRGWIDGKGVFKCNKDNILISFKTSGPVFFLDQFMNKLQELGINKKNIVMSSKDKSIGYVIYKNKDELETISNYLYYDCTTYLNKKKELAFSY